MYRAWTDSGEYNGKLYSFSPESNTLLPVGKPGLNPSIGFAFNAIVMQFMYYEAITTLSNVWQNP